MRYSEFHPEYGDVGLYFNRVAEELGLQGEIEGGLPQNSPHHDP